MVTQTKKAFSPVKMAAGRCWLKDFDKRYTEVSSKVSINGSNGSEFQHKSAIFFHTVPEMGREVGCGICSKHLECRRVWYWRGTAAQKLLE